LTNLDFGRANLPNSTQIKVEIQECSAFGLDKPIIFSEQQIHLWQIPLKPSPWLYQYLSPDELSRSERFHLDTHRQSYLSARGWLRKILSLYLDLEPQEIRFTCGQFGKPGIDNNNKKYCIEFNLSHSGGLALYGVAIAAAIGIDVEAARPATDYLALAQRWFSRAEAMALASLPPDQLQAGFLQIWTTKEAYLKATGEGLQGLGRVNLAPPVNFTALEPGRFRPVLLEATPVWQFVPNDDYWAAVAVLGEVRSLRYYQVVVD
jgi:4'-phosphopantetheinyl transferase